MLTFETVLCALVLMAETMDFPKRHDVDAAEWWLALMESEQVTEGEFKSAMARLVKRMAPMPTVHHYLDEIELIREERRSALARSIVAVPLDQGPSSLPSGKAVERE